MFAIRLFEKVVEKGLKFVIETRFLVQYKKACIDFVYQCGAELRLGGYAWRLAREVTRQL